MPEPEQRHGERRRRQILAAAMDVSSAEGLEGLSIGRLAREVGLSKSGLAAHFVSKQALQLATVEAAAAGYERHVIEPPRRAEAGLARLEAMMEAWIAYIDEIEYRGGCFFAAAANEFGSQPGPVRDRVATYTKRWMDLLEAEARTAVRQREILPDTDPRQLAFALHAFVQEANLCRRLLGDERAFERARGCVADTLARVRLDSPAPDSRGANP